MIAHSIKGAASNIGINRFSTIAAQIESAGHSGDLETIDRLTPELEKQFEIAILAIRNQIPLHITR